MRDNEFLIGGSGITTVILGSIGAVSLGVGILQLNVISPIAHALIGLGLIVMSLGLYIFFHSKSYRIRVNIGKKSITIIEKTFRKSNFIEKPIGKYSGILVQPRVGNGEGNRSTLRYEVMLISDQGSTILFSEYKNEENALAFARNLQTKYGLSLHYDDELSQIFKMKRSSIEEKAAIIPSNSSSIYVSAQGEKVSLKWKTMRDPITIFTILMGIWAITHGSLYCCSYYER